MSTLTKNKTNSAFSRLLKRSEFTIGIVVVILFLIATFSSKTFFSEYNLMNLSKQGAIIGVLAVAQTLIIITSGIDISGGAIAGLGCMTMALMIRGGQPVWFAIVINFIVCIVCGLINGVIIFDLKVPAMITTLGTSTIYRAILKLACNGNSVTFFKPGTQEYVDIFYSIGNYNIFGKIPVLCGSGIEVARLSGVKVRKTFYLVYSVAGLIYGVGAVMFAGRILRGATNTGEGYDMQAIAAAVIGGASLAGGRGAITGTFIGTLLMTVIENAGKARPFGIAINDYVLEIITGALIIIAVTMDMMKSRKKA